jgi:hypothetical protein
LLLQHMEESDEGCAAASKTSWIARDFWFRPLLFPRALAVPDWFGIGLSGFGHFIE